MIDSQPLQIAEALVNLLIELQTVNSFDPLRHRVYVPLQIVTSENTDA
ncbi:LacI family transcriptional regulator [Pseudomonas syringae pv. maculicola]|nr:LacI family transcriptional regulator [Pseudomonas syringae pv. maculicola]